MKEKRELYRIDLNLKYLYLTKDKPTKEAVLDWLHNIHTGELDDGLNIKKVESVEDIQDYENEDGELNYDLYTDKIENLNLSDVIEPLQLDVKCLIKRLKELGYKVTK